MTEKHLKSHEFRCFSVILYARVIPINRPNPLTQSSRRCKLLLLHSLNYLERLWGGPKDWSHVAVTTMLPVVCLMQTNWRMTTVQWTNPIEIDPTKIRSISVVFFDCKAKTIFKFYSFYHTSYSNIKKLKLL